MGNIAANQEPDYPREDPKEEENPFLDHVDDRIEDDFSENSYDSNDLAEAEVAFGKWSNIVKIRELTNQREQVNFYAQKNQRVFVDI